MNLRTVRGLGIAAALVAMLAAGCATRPSVDRRPDSIVPLGPHAVLTGPQLDPALEDRILALDPTRITDADVRTVLAKGPTPRIVNLHGGIYPVHLAMESFARFLVRMGYPEDRIRDPGDGELSRSPYEDSGQIAGRIAWFYERDGLRPLLIGHSQGGMQIVKVLYELNGTFAERIPVFNPLTGEREDRFEIVDPLTGERRSVVGLVLPYASAVASGGAATLLPNQWSMARRLYAIPDTVENFVGYTLGIDLVAWDFGSGGRYRANGRANVRNVALPADYSHVAVVATGHLGRDPNMRNWINAYSPADAQSMPPLPEGDATNIFWAADVWFSVKQYWCLEAQRFVRARRALVATTSPE